MIKIIHIIDRLTKIDRDLKELEVLKNKIPNKRYYSQELIQSIKHQEAALLKLQEQFLSLSFDFEKVIKHLGDDNPLSEKIKKLTVEKIKFTTAKKQSSSLTLSKTNKTTTNNSAYKNSQQIVTPNKSNKHLNTHKIDKPTRIVKKNENLSQIQKEDEFTFVFDSE